MGFMWDDKGGQTHVTVTTDGKGNAILTPDYIDLNAEIVEAYEQGIPGSELLLDSTLEHEIMHWLDVTAGAPLYSGEIGKDYEVGAYGRDVGPEVLAWRLPR